jgi:glycosyltransferase involved in cell wall biosynthesis
MSSPRPPRVSIGVPAYNAQRYLPQALDSLLAQTYSDIEIIVCDNASSDGTEVIAREYAARDRRIRYVRNPENIGAGRNFARCVELARGELFRWASADDLSAPTFVERCVEALDARPDVMQAYPRTILIDDNGAELERCGDDIQTLADSPRQRYLHVMRSLRLVNAFYGVMRTALLRRTGMHGPYIGADLVVQAEIALYGKIYEVPEYLFFRRMHAEAHSAMTVAQAQTFYTPGTRRHAAFWKWRQLAERLLSVLRGPITLRDKALLCATLLRDAIASRDQLLSELWAVLRARWSRSEAV